MKAIFNGKEIDIHISKEAKRELAAIKKKICKDCPFKCKEGESCKIKC